jgi:hypothetical protein
MTLWAPSKSKTKLVISRLSTSLIARQQNAFTMAVVTRKTNTTDATNTIDAPVRAKHVGRRVLRGLARVAAVTLALIMGPVADQAALHGLLRKVRDLGMPLISVSSHIPTYARIPKTIPPTIL